MLRTGSGPGALLSAISREPGARAELMERTGLARTTVAQHLAALEAMGLVAVCPDPRPSTGGRPARVFDLRADAAVALVVDMGERRARLAVAGLRGALLAEDALPIDVGAPPPDTLAALLDALRALLRRAGRCEREVLGIGLGLPAPVDFGRGCAVGPSVMPGWDGFDIPAWFAGATDTPVTVENDVNLLALFEHRAHWPAVDPFLFVKAGTGIGSGIVADGRLFRGAQGAAGDIGHIQADPVAGPLCRCGKKGCLEASAAGWAILRDLAGGAAAPATFPELLPMLAAHRPDVVERVRAAGRAMGATVAGVVSVLNPAAIVVGGGLGRTGEAMLGGLRELVYARSLPLATRELVIAPARGGADAGLRGAALLVSERELEPARVDASLRRLAGARPLPRAASLDGAPL